jgi:NRAMP (natural resistance-associated macrophage protein)-like metal ion transporter
VVFQDSSKKRGSSKKHHPARFDIRGKGYFHRLGPGIVTGAADDDPSGIGTYSQAGAAAGYGFLWSAVWLLPLAFATQEACARLALVTGKGLAAIIRATLPRWVLIIAVLLVSVANTVNIAADLGSMAAALRLLVPIDQVVGVVGFAVLMAFIEIVVPYHRYAKVLRWLCLSLLAYVAVLFVARVDWHAVALNTILPHIDFKKSSLELLIALAGTTISPYLFFWQAAEEVEERHEPEVPEGGTKLEVAQEHVAAMRGDVFSGMLTGVFIMFAIMATSAATLNATGILNINSAEDAAAALRPIAGDFAGLLFLLGILGVGLLSVPVLAGSTAYALSETFGWKASLELKPWQARPFYAVIVASVGIAVLLNLIGVEPMRFLVLAAVWYLARDRKLLGRWVSPVWSQVLLGLATLAMALLPVFWIFAA